MKKYFSKYDINVLCIAIGSSLILTDNLRSAGFIMIVLGLISILFKSIKKPILKIKKNTSLKILFLFAICSTFGGFVRGYGLTSSILAIIFVLVFYVIVIYDFYKIITLKLIIDIHVLIFIIGIFINPIRLFSYNSIFYNPNSLGGIAASLILLLLALYLDSKNNNIDITLRFFLTRLFPILFFLIISSSRASILTVIFSVFLYFVFIFFQSFKFFFRKFKYLVLIFVLSLPLLFSNFFYEFLNISLLTKVNNKSDNISSNRMEIWGIIIDNINFFGHGRNFNILFSDFAGSAHNTFLSMLGQNGFLAFFFYFIFWIIIFFRGVKIIRQSSLLFFITSCFLTLSMFESMHNKLSMYITFFMFANSYRMNKKFNKSLRK